MIFKNNLYVVINKIIYNIMISYNKNIMYFNVVSKIDFKFY